MTNDCNQVGFEHPAIRRQRAQTRPMSTAYPGLITTAALVFSIVVAATAVSMGMARADTLTTIAESDGGRLALATMVGLVLAGMGGLTAAMFRGSDHNRPE
jgi:hypothetical protein